MSERPPASASCSSVIHFQRLNIDESSRSHHHGVNAFSGHLSALQGRGVGWRRRVVKQCWWSRTYPQRVVNWSHLQRPKNYHAVAKTPRRERHRRARKAKRTRQPLCFLLGKFSYFFFIFFFLFLSFCLSQPIKPGLHGDKCIKQPLANGLGLTQQHREPHLSRGEEAHPFQPAQVRGPGFVGDGEIHLWGFGVWGVPCRPSGYTHLQQ